MADETCAIDFLKLPLEVCLTRSTPVKFKDEEVVKDIWRLHHSFLLQCNQKWKT